MEDLWGRGGLLLEHRLVGEDDRVPVRWAQLLTELVEDVPVVIINQEYDTLVASLDQVLDSCRVQVEVIFTVLDVDPRVYEPVRAILRFELLFGGHGHDERFRAPASVLDFALGFREC